MNFIELTDDNSGQKMLVNISTIKIIKKDEDGDCCFTCGSGFFWLNKKDAAKLLEAIGTKWSE